MIGRDRPPGPTDYLFDWITWLQGEEQEQFANEFARVRASGTAAELADLATTPGLAAIVANAFERLEQAS